VSSYEFNSCVFTAVKYNSLKKYVYAFFLRCYFMGSAREIKTKYYWREILKYLFVGGVLALGGGGSYAGNSIARKIFQSGSNAQRKKTNTFYYLKKRGLIEMRREGHDVRIALTKKGKQLAGKYQIDDLSIPRPKKWDKKWRLIIFDIPATSNIIRDVFRGKLKEFGFYQLQKSIWIYPFECKEEIKLLRDFLGANPSQIQVLQVSRMEDDRHLRKVFGL